MFLMNVESLMPVVQNLCSEVKLFLSAETLPVLLISNAVTVVLMCVMSVEKCSNLFAERESFSNGLIECCVLSG